jgi:LysM repeat protein
MRCRRVTRWFILLFVVTSLLRLQAPSLQAASSPSGAEAKVNVVAAWSCRGVYHVVGRGETIYSIARRYGTTAYRIAVCNGLASYTVYAGQTLLVPTLRG